MQFVRSLVGTLLAITCYSVAANELVLPIVGGIDGDTLRTYVSLPPPLNRVSIRIRGIDTPEKGKRAACAQEAMLADKASLATKELIANATTMVVSSLKWDKYGGRIVGDVSINGVDIGQALIAQGVAAPYGGGKKQSWCR